MIVRFDLLPQCPNGKDVEPRAKANLANYKALIICQIGKSFGQMIAVNKHIAALCQTIGFGEIHITKLARRGDGNAVVVSLPVKLGGGDGCAHWLPKSKYCATPLAAACPVAKQAVSR